MAYGLVNDSGAREQYTASIGETNFSYPFEIFADGDLDVWLTPNGQEPDPVLDLLVLNTDYTVTGAGDPGGGDVVLVVAATGGDVITIERDVPIERLADFSVGGDFRAASINQQLDKLTMTQQQNEMVNEKRQLTYLPTDELIDGDVDLPKLAIGQLWMKGAAGGLVAGTPEESTGWSILRSELANDLSGTDGARIVGYYDSVRGSETVKDKLDNQVDLPVPDTTSIVHDPVTPSKQMRIDVGAVSAATVRVLTMPDKDIDLSSLDKGAAKAWAVFNGTTGVLERGYNISSIIRNGVGDYTIPLDITSASGKYVVQVSCIGPLASAPDGGITQSVTSIASTNFSIELLDTLAALRDSTQVYVVVFGDDFT